MIEELWWKLIGAIVAAYIGYNEWRLKNMENRIRRGMSKEDVDDAIRGKEDINKVIQGDLKDDVKEIKAKIDELYKELISRR